MERHLGGSVVGTSLIVAFHNLFGNLSLSDVVGHLTN